MTALITAIITVIGGAISLWLWLSSAKREQMKIKKEIERKSNEYEDWKQKRSSTIIGIGDSVSFYYADNECRRLSKEIGLLRARLTDDNNK